MSFSYFYLADVQA